MWPQPGYWAINERGDGFKKCGAPLRQTFGDEGLKRCNPAGRCAGYSGTRMNFADPASLCGVGYTGTLCASCADGYYKDGRECCICVDQEEKYKPLIGLLVTLFFLFVFVCVLVHLGTKWKSNMYRWHTGFGFHVWKCRIGCQWAKTTRYHTSASVDVRLANLDDLL